MTTRNHVAAEARHLAAELRRARPESHEANVLHRAAVEIERRMQWLDHFYLLSRRGEQDELHLALEDALLGRSAPEAEGKR